MEQRARNAGVAESAYTQACAALEVPFWAGMDRIDARVAALTDGQPLTDLLTIDDLRTLARTNEILVLTSFVAKHTGRPLDAADELEAALVLRVLVARIAMAKGLIDVPEWRPGGRRA